MDIDDLIEKLSGLDLPQIMPEEPWPPVIPHPVNLRNGMFRDYDGQPLCGDLDTVLDTVAQLAELPDGRLATGLIGWHGFLIEVSTNYLAVDVQAGASHLPNTWQTKVSINEQTLCILWYATRAAAHHGHRSIVDTLGLPETIKSADATSGAHRMS